MKYRAGPVEPVYRPSTVFKTWGQPVLVGWCVRALVDLRHPRRPTPRELQKGA